MRAVFMGTPDFARMILESLVESGQEVIGVYTQPDRPKGRSGELSAPPVKEYALSCGLPVHQPERIRRPFWVRQLQELAPDLIIVAAYGQILPPSILNIAPCVNVHASLLPKYRGSSPIHAAIACGETETGVTLMRMDEGMDTGNILCQLRVPISGTDTVEVLHDALAEAGKKGLAEVLRRFENGDPLIGEKQPEEGVTYAPMLNREDGKVNWTDDAGKIDCRFRAYTPWPGSWTTLDGKVLKILQASPFVPSEDFRTPPAEERPGTVLSAQECRDIGLDPQTIAVRTGKDLLILKQLQLAGKKPMSAADFLRGRDIRGKELGQ